MGFSFNAGWEGGSWPAGGMALAGARNLAKNAGTSVEQIERFYARNLLLSAEMARNLQSFGGTND
jgi:hypothetical protein